VILIPMYFAHRHDGLRAPLRLIDERSDPAKRMCVLLIFHASPERTSE
jgi:hypothetical protein